MGISRMSSESPMRAELVEALHQQGRQMGEAVVMFHQAIADRLGLNTTDHECADILSRTGPITAGEIAELTGLTTGAITGVIDRLEAVGFVRRERDPNDRRRVIVQLTIDPERERQIHRLFEPMAQAMMNLCATYNDRDIAVIRDFMEKCRSIFREATVRLKEERNDRE